MKLRLHKKLFNKQFFEFKSSAKPIAIFWGGKGSSKSYSIAQGILTECLDKKMRVLVARNVGASLNDSCISLFKEIINAWKLDESVVKFIGQPFNKLVFPNGSEILFKGLDDSMKLQSLNSINIAWIEESNECSYEQIMDVYSRVRGANTAYKFKITDSTQEEDIFISASNARYQLILSFNPISENHWIKENFFDNPEWYKDVDDFHSTCLDNKFLRPEDVEKYRRLQYTDLARYRVEFLGQWGITSKDNLAYSCFDPTKHLGHLQYDPNSPLHISLDDNINPAQPILVAQLAVGQTTTVKVIDEVFIKNYNLQKSCEEFIKRYKGHKGGLFIYGDATAYKKTNTSDYNFFQLALRYLQEFNPQLRVTHSNAPVKQRIDFVNKHLYENNAIKVLIDYKCKNMVNDFEAGRLDAEGKKDKRTVQDKATKVNYQPYHHMSDCFDYLLTTSCSKEWSRFNGSAFYNKPVFQLRPTISNFR